MEPSQELLAARQIINQLLTLVAVLKDLASSHYVDVCNNIDDITSTISADISSHMQHQKMENDNEL